MRLVVFTEYPRELCKAVAPLLPDASLLVWNADGDLTVKAPRPAQGGVNSVGAVSGSNHQDVL